MTRQIRILIRHCPRQPKVLGLLMNSLACTIYSTTTRKLSQPSGNINIYKYIDKRPLAYQQFRIRFAHEDKDLLAISSMDGTISICSTFDNPSVLGILKGHTKGVTGNNILHVDRCSGSKYLA